MIFIQRCSLEFNNLAICSTAHVQVYNKTHATHHASRNFVDNSCVGLMQHEEYTACE